MLETTNHISTAHPTFTNFNTIKKFREAGIELWRRNYINTIKIGIGQLTSSTCINFNTNKKIWEAGIEKWTGNYINTIKIWEQGLG